VSERSLAEILEASRAQQRRNKTTPTILYIVAGLALLMAISVMTLEGTAAWLARGIFSALALGGIGLFRRR
jgi:hypothetical protein